MYYDNDILMRRAVEEAGVKMSADFTQRVMQRVKQEGAQAACEQRVIAPRRRMRWLQWVAAACIAVVAVSAWMYMGGEPGHRRQELTDAQMAALLAPTAEDSLRMQMDAEIERELAEYGCEEGSFMCQFSSHSQLIEDNHNPQYVNNVLGRMLSLCQRDGDALTVADDRRTCIATLETISVELGADEQNANNLGVGLCLQCIRALGGEV